VDPDGAGRPVRSVPVVHVLDRDAAGRLEVREIVAAGD
jgi:hypothetical protein